MRWEHSDCSFRKLLEDRDRWNFAGLRRQKWWCTFWQIPHMDPDLVLTLGQQGPELEEAEEFYYKV